MKKFTDHLRILLMYAILGAVLYVVITGDPLAELPHPAVLPW